MITSGETDIPWELVHVWAPDAGEDPEGRGFLGRAGLVRWVYNTGHPTDLSVRTGSGPLPHPRVRRPGARARAGAAGADLPPALRRHRHRPAGRRRHRPAPHERAGRPAPLRRPRVQQRRRRSARQGDGPRGLPPRRCRPSPGADRSRIAFSLEDLRSSLPDSPPLRFGEPGPLVFLNACRIGQAPSTRSEAGGFAETFLRGGAGAFVGCLWSVGDKPAREFVAAFYSALDAGHTIARATLAGRRAAREAGDISWLAYTVYAHPDAGSPTARAAPPETDPSSKGTAMTHHHPKSPQGPGPHPATSSRRSIPSWSALEDGKLADGASTLPTGVDDFQTVKADIDELFDDPAAGLHQDARQAGADDAVGPRRSGATRPPDCGSPTPRSSLVAGQRRASRCTSSGAPVSPSRCGTPSRTACPVGREGSTTSSTGSSRPRCAAPAARTPGAP